MCDDEMSPKEKEYEPIRLMEIEIKSLKKKFLHHHGWEESCDFVDACWRWVKEIPSRKHLGSRIYMCSMSEAIKIELNFLYFLDA